MEWLARQPMALNRTHKKILKCVWKFNLWERFISYHWHKDGFLKQIVLGQLNSHLEEEKIIAESHTIYRDQF